MSVASISYLLLWILVCLLLVSVVGLYSAFGVLYRSSAIGTERPSQPNLFGPDIGDTVQVPPLVDTRGEPVAATVRRWIFSSTTCRACADMKAGLRELSPSEFEGRTVVVCRGERADVRAWAADVPDWVSVVVDEDGAVSAAFSVQATPLYVGLDDAQQCVIAGPASNKRALQRFDRLADERVRLRVSVPV